jgi:hypothetical protein
MSDGRNHHVFEVGGKVYNLRVSYNAFAEYNKIATLEDLKSQPFAAYRALIWSCINAYGSQSVTLNQAGDICEQFITEKGFVAFIKEGDKILKAGVWLESLSRGIDTGNPEQAVLPTAKADIKPSKKCSPNTSGSRTVSEG